MILGCAIIMIFMFEAVFERHGMMCVWNPPSGFRDEDPTAGANGREISIYGIV
jgi:hypothetical protein